MLNQLTLLGRLTRDVETRHTQGGTLIAKGGIAVDSYAGKDDRGEAKKRVLFLDFVAFGTVGENIAKHFKKGEPIVLLGELTYQTWEAKDGGGKRSKHEMLVDRFQFVPRSADREAGSEPAPKTGQRATGTPPKGTQQDYGDIPF